MGYSAKTIVQTAIDTVNEKYGKVWYRRYNRFQNDGYDYNVGKYHDGIWSFDCLGFVHTMVNGFKGITSLLGGGALMDDFVNMSNESVTLTKYCSVRGQFPKKDIKPASLLMMSGHVGLFIGERTENGQIINSAEVTCAMGAGGKFSWVDLTTGKRYSCKGGDYLGMWTNWGQFDRVDYDYDGQETSKQTDDNAADTGRIYGVDLCYHQGDIDFKKLKNAGIQFIIPRDGWGVNCDGQEIDKKFLTNVSEALKAGIKVPGVYHFIYAVNVNEAIENAKCAIRNVEKAGLPKSTVIWCDQEEDTVVTAKKQGYNVTAKMQTEITQAFCDYCLAQGYCTGVYLNQDYITRVYGKDIINQYDIWLADLEGEAYCKCLYRQINWYGKVDGVSGNIDVDEYYGQYTAGTAKPKSNTDNQTDNASNNNYLQLVANNCIVVKYGSTGVTVKLLQTLLKQLGYYAGNIDGSAGNITVAAIKQYQSKNNLETDGIFGAKSWFRMLTDHGEAIAKLMPTIGKNSNGDAVKLLQGFLKSAGYYFGNIDGDAGNLTVNAIIKIQTEWHKTDNSILIDGYFGQQCWSKLLISK